MTYDSTYDSTHDSNWSTFHHRGEILRSVISTTDHRRDGILPMHVTGVAETFEDELSLLGALQLRWHTRLAGRIERELSSEPMDLQEAVIGAWRATNDELPGVRLVLDHYRAEPTDETMATAMAKATTKEHVLLATMAGVGNAQDPASAPMGLAIEELARHSSAPVPRASEHRGESTGLFVRLMAALVA